MIDRLINSQEYSFIALRTNGLLAVVLSGLALLTFAVLPSIVA